MAFPDPYPPQHWSSSAHEEQGMEFDWFARDREGHLAVFSSAGRGFIPQSVFSATVVPYNEFIASIAGRTKAAAVLAFKENGQYHDWKVYAEHGLFAYDFQDVHRTAAEERRGYDLIYRPTVPATTTDILSLPALDTVFGSSDLVPLSLLHKLDEA